MVQVLLYGIIIFQRHLNVSIHYKHSYFRCHCHPKCFLKAAKIIYKVCLRMGKKSPQTSNY